GLAAYHYSVNLGVLGSPQDLAAYTRANCSSLFPIAGCVDDFSVGDTMHLHKSYLFYTQSFPVKVIHETSTSFEFEALNRHPEGRGGRSHSASAPAIMATRCSTSTRLPTGASSPTGGTSGTPTSSWLMEHGRSSPRTSAATTTTWLPTATSGQRWRSGDGERSAREAPAAAAGADRLGRSPLRAGR